MKLSAIICTRNRPEKLRRAVRSVLSQDNGRLAELVVIDQSDRPVDIRVLGLESKAQLRYVRTNSRGLSRARNEALAVARGEIIAFTDDDCVVAPGWVESICEAFAKHPELDAVFGRVLAYSEDSVSEGVEHHSEYSEYGLTTYASKQGDLYCSALFDATEPAVFDRPCLPYANLGSGNNMAYRRSVFDTFGGFVTRLGAGTDLCAAEDTEFQYRLLIHGCRLAYLPHVLVYHDNWLTFSQNAHLQAQYLTGVVALFVWYALRGDPLSRELVGHKFREMRHDITEHEPVEGMLDHIWYAGSRWLAFLRGLVGGGALLWHMPVTQRSKTKTV